MIPSVAVKRFIKQPRDDHRWMKNLSVKELDACIAELDPMPRLHPIMRAHQKVSFLLGVAYPQFSFWLDMGLGKTLLTLELMKYWRQCGKLKRGLIFLLSDTAMPTWEKQISQYDIGLPYVSLEGSSVEKWHKLNNFKQSGLVLVSYPGAVAMLSKRVERKRKGGMAIDAALVKEFRSHFTAMAMDESTRAGHTSSLTHKLCARLSEHIPIRYALAGRPFGRDPTLLWGQQQLIDRGESLGPTLGLFRAACFSERKNPFVKSRYAFTYKFKRSARPLLRRMMQHRSIQYHADECIDVPRVNRFVEEIAFPVEAQAYYTNLANQMAKAKGDYREVKNVFLRMRQITSGFLGFKNDETGERAELEFSHNPKLERLTELLSQLPDGRKAVVFYEFTWSGQRIVQAVKDLGLEHIWLWSGTDDTRAALDRFINTKNSSVAVVNNRLGAYSIDGLQVANYPFFYESPVSYIDREQAERRVNRQGQKRKVFQYDLVIKNSVDVRILKFHAEGADLMQAMRKNPKAIIGKLV